MSRRECALQLPWVTEVPMKHTLVAALGLVAICSAPALAHHPFAAEYDWKQPVTLTGTITKFQWANPHSTMEVKGKSDKGTDATWTIELGSPEQLSKAGWTKTQVHAGDQVSVDGWMAKDGSKRVSGKSVTVSGKEMFAAGAFFEPSMHMARGAGDTPKATSGQKSSSSPSR